jgi:2'-5' RNA ligase
MGIKTAIIQFSLIFTLLTTMALPEISRSEYSWTLSAQVYEAHQKAFQSHRGSGAFDNYLSMEIDYAPVADLYSQLEKFLQSKLRNRGEAHITVITPVEYTQSLSTKLTMEDIDQIAQNMKIQEADFKVICLGRGQLKIKDQNHSTYFIVVESESLLKIRLAVRQLYLSRGGSPEKFMAEKFYPHITIGFTQRDLHLEDGVLKDKSSCLGELKIIN